jgi:hypothetical protein
MGFWTAWLPLSPKGSFLPVWICTLPLDGHRKLIRFQALIMRNKLIRQPWLLFGGIFLLFTVLIWILGRLFNDFPLQSSVLYGGNAILFLATALSFYLYRKSLQSNQPGYFMRMIYGGLFAKLMICMMAAIIYILVARNSVDKYAIFACFGLYFIYTFAEVKLLMYLSKEQKNA